jgi:thiamine biosynthesis lipoprotein
MEEGTTSDAGVPMARVSGSRRLMGVPWTVTVHAATTAAGERGVAAALDEVERLEAILSDYRPDSELSRLSAAAPTTHPVPVSDDLWAVLSRAEVFRKESDGAFDPTVGPLTTLWRQSRRSGVLPLEAKLAAARGAVGPGALVLRDDPRGVLLTRPRMRLDLGGIGMGYAIDRALAILTAQGIDSALVDASGDVGVSAPPPGQSGWRIAIDPIPGTPAAATGQILLTHAAITTSGDARQSVAIGGRRYSHIVDPRTGIGIDGPAAVTVIAPDATAADALATAANVLGPVRGRTLLENQAGCAGRFVSVSEEGNGAVREVQTSRWPAE